MKRNLFLILALAGFLAGCGDDDNAPPQVGSDACSVDGQKQFVLERMQTYYFWNDLLPQNVAIDSFSSAEELLAYLVSFQPLDDFSYIDSSEADAQFFGAGQYLGYGFRSRLEDPDELYLTSVFAASPAAAAGLERGQQVLRLNGRTIAEIQAGTGLDAVLSESTLEFQMRRPDGSEFTFVIAKGQVTIDPVPQWRLIDRQDGTSVGYFELSTFIGTADAALESVFAEFNAARVTDIIIDLRYNGGGLVSTTELLGDYLGGAIATNLVFSRTLFNAQNANANRTRFLNLLQNSASTSRLVVIASNNTASASELIVNSMKPHVAVSIVGASTYGKPVGQLGIEFCDKILRPTAFETVNANNEGRYYDGIAVDCPVQDDLFVPVGDDSDENLQTALGLLATGACPVSNDATRRVTVSPAHRKLAAGLPRPPWREHAGAW